jgi:hypothetical protein
MSALFTPAEVHSVAFSGEELIRQELITQSDIVEAETRYVRPILGEALCEAIAASKYSALRNDYVLPAVAAWCRYIVEPLRDMRCGECRGVDRTTADNDHLKVVVRSLRRKASTLSRSLSNHLNSHCEEYVEYNPKYNPLNHCSIYGDIIQVY